MAVGTLQSVVSAALHHVSRAPGGVQDEAIGKTVKPSLGPPFHFPQSPCPSVYHRQWGRGKRPKGHLMTSAEGSGLLRSQNTHQGASQSASEKSRIPWSWEGPSAEANLGSLPQGGAWTRTRELGSGHDLAASFPDPGKSLSASNPVQ